MTEPSARSRHLLVTAGPTQEPIDEVRYLSNRSSGRMGIAIAQAAAARGWTVTLLLGPVPQAGIPSECDSQPVVVRFRTTADLERLLAEHGPSADVVVMAAAVADYRPAGGVHQGKLERGAGLTLELESTPDLLAGLVTRRPPGQRLVGFALEPAELLLERARSKLARKGVDAIVANPLETMDAATVTGVLVHADGTAEAAPEGIEKPAFAAWLVNRLLADAPDPRRAGQRDG